MSELTSASQIAALSAADMIPIREDGVPGLQYTTPQQISDFVGGGGGGSSWDFVPPLAADFTTNSGDATQVTLTDDANIGLMIDNGTGVSSNIQRIATRPLASSGAADFTSVAHLKITGSNVAGTMGLILYESATNKLMIAGVLSLNSRYAWYGDLTNFSGGIFNYTDYIKDFWIQIRYVHATATYAIDFSFDGKSWVQEATFAATTAFTVRANRIGFGFQNAGVTTKRSKISVPYFSLT